MKWKSCLKRWIAAAVAGGMMGMMGGLLPEIVPEVAAPMTAEAAGATLEDEMAKFPQGKYWNHIGGSNNPDGYTDTPCTHHGDSCSKNNYNGSCGCNSFRNSIQCYGFSLKVAYDIYGQNPYSWSKDTDVSNLKAGDVMRVGGDLGGTNFGKKGGHSIIIVAVNGDQVTYGDCNGDGNKSCKILWDHVKTKAQMKSWMTENGDGVFHAPYEAPHGTISKKWYDSYEIVNLGDSFDARIENPASGYFLTADQTNVTGKAATLDETQVWHFTRNADGSYAIVNEAANYSLDIADNGTAAGTNVQLMPYVGNDAQKYFIYRYDGAYLLRPACSDLVFDLEGYDATGAAVAGSYNLATYPLDTNTGNKKFSIMQWHQGDMIADLGTDFDARIENPASGYFLTADQTNVTGKAATLDETQVWHFTRNTDGSYAIVNEAANYSMDIADYGTAAGSNVQLMPYVGNDAQRYFIYRYDGAYLFRPACSDLVFDLEGYDPKGSKLAASYNLAMYPLDANSGNKKFSIIKWHPGETLADLGTDFDARIENPASGYFLTADQTNVTGKAATLDETQVWHFTRNTDGSYAIVNEAANYSMDIADYGTAAGSNVQLMPYVGNDAQRYFIYRYDGAYLFRPACSDLVFDLEGYDPKGSKLAASYNLSTYPLDANSGNKKFSIIKWHPGETLADLGTDFDARIENPASGYFLTADQTNVTGKAATLDETQVWHFTRNTDGSYAIVNEAANYSMDIADYGTAAGSNVQLMPYVGNDAQRYFIYRYDGAYLFRPACSDLVFDLEGYDPKGSKLAASYNLATYPLDANTGNKLFVIQKNTDKIAGDLNADGKTNVTDLVLLQKWILKVPKTSLKDAGAADMNADGVVDIFDLALLKRKLLQTK